MLFFALLDLKDLICFLIKLSGVPLHNELLLAEAILSLSLTTKDQSNQKQLQLLETRKNNYIQLFCIFHDQLCPITQASKFIPDY